MSTFNNFINGEWVAGAATASNASTASTAPNGNPSDTSGVMSHYARANKAQTETAGPARRQASRKPA